MKSGEFPKIFPYTKFNKQIIQGEIEVNEKGVIVFKKHPSGQGFIDKIGRLVNNKGYLTDKNGNIVD